MSLDVLLHWLWEKVSLQCVLNQLVRNRPESISQVKEGDVECFLVNPSVLNYLLHGNVVLDTAINSREEGLLDLRINELVLEEIGGCSLREDEVVEFTDTTCECNHAKV